MAPVTDEETEAQQIPGLLSPQRSDPRFEHKALCPTTLSPTFSVAQSLGHPGRKFVSKLLALTVDLLDSSVCFISGGARREGRRS